MNYRPDTTKTMTPLYRPPEIKHVGAKTFKGELDMYCWLLEKIVKKCTVAGVGEMDQVKDDFKFQKFGIFLCL